ncbi:hypothetical protein [Aeropyrum camini]|uniref:4-aminobutyrate aminotransferase n=1 Tax=Aeropyrum camini SY1 = JCM 12091 TaxID=1198449 RepID=U3TEE8_9CREN|nr:hypothetical protein [Aeropyrum camini]BAN89694.1 4-aminobutyrate aminotransferase [Aeropyrum camini SY1 = JCM 12091]
MQRTRRLVSAVLLTIRALGLIVRLGVVYIRLRIRLGLWRTVSKIQFKRKTRMLPKSLARELSEEYERFVNSMRLPGLAGLTRVRPPVLARPERRRSKHGR